MRYAKRAITLAIGLVIIGGSIGAAAAEVHGSTATAISTARGTMTGMAITIGAPRTAEGSIATGEVSITRTEVIAQDVGVEREGSR